MKIVGMQSVVSTTKAGEETSQAVYPRASNVFSDTPVGERGCIRFLLDEQFAGKTFNHFRSFSEFDEAVMFLGCSVRQRLEPVRVVGDVEGLCPTFHAVGNQVCHFAVDGSAFFDGVGHGFVGFTSRYSCIFLRSKTWLP